MKILLIDTETTGLPKAGDQYGPHQPWVIQLAAVYFDLQEDRIERTMNTLVLPPEGVEFHPKAVAVHGFSEEVVRSNGKDPKEVYEELRDLRRASDMVTAYNWEFDERLVRTSSERACPEFMLDPVLGVHKQDVQHHCVMQQSIAYFKCRQKLSYVYKNLFGVQFEDAHDAMADAVAAMKVMKELTVRQLGKAGA